MHCVFLLERQSLQLNKDRGPIVVFKGFFNDRVIVIDFVIDFFQEKTSRF